MSKTRNCFRYLNNQGQILVLSLVVLSLVLISTLAITSGSLTYFQSSRNSLEGVQAVNLAEAGLDKAVASLNNLGGVYTGESETFLGAGSYSVTITSLTPTTKLIKSTGYIPNKANPKVKRTVTIQASPGVGVSFVYGVQVGEGGLELGNNNQVTGSIYSNGSITMGNNNTITGDAWVAGGPQPAPDQQTDCVGSSCTNFDFGKNINGEDRLDVAQSFTPQTSAVLNKVSLKLKKNGNPSDVTVRILRNSGTIPDKNQVLASGTLFANLVTSSYGFIDVTFSTTPSLNAGTTYWIMVDTSSDNNNFWSWQNDSLQSYNSGLPKYSSNWQAGNPNWNNLTGGGDLSFKVYMSGVVTKISGNGNGNLVGGDIHANTIESLTIQSSESRSGYYLTQSNLIVNGQNCTTNPSPPKCNPGSGDPPPKVFPISDANITEWKNNASDPSKGGGVISGNITNCVATLGPIKIVGDVTLDNRCTVTVKSPIWITGKLNLNNENTLKLDQVYGGTSGVIVVDGQIELGNKNTLVGTGVGTSLLVALSTYDSRTNGVPAVKINNTGNTGVFYANNGIIEPGNNNQFKELTAWGIRLTNNSTINYETGLSSTMFSSGPAGSFSVIKGTYQAK